MIIPWLHLERPHRHDVSKGEGEIIILIPAAEEKAILEACLFEKFD